MNKRIFIKKILHPFFCPVFARYLDEMWSNFKWWRVDEGNEIVIMVNGTNGWDTALKNTCEDLEIEDCYEYYKSLDWIKSDELDADIVMLLEAVVFDEDGNRYEVR